MCSTGKQCLAARRMSRTVSGLPIYFDMGYSKPVLSRLAPVRELRDLMRYRKTIVQERADEVNRLQKVLETANSKLASVATDLPFAKADGAWLMPCSTAKTTPNC